MFESGYSNILGVSHFSTFEFVPRLQTNATQSTLTKPAYADGRTPRVRYSKHQAQASRRDGEISVY